MQPPRLICAYKNTAQEIRTPFSKCCGLFKYVSVVTNYGYSDWATTEIPSTVKTMWYRLSRREDDYCIECSEDGMHFRQMRICHLHKGNGKIRFGIYACSPEDSSFTAKFTDFAITECMWKAHDGQQPDF